MPRSRWFALVVAALLCVLGGANRGRVPAHEHEGSRTADEPALRSARSSIELVRRIVVHRPIVVSHDRPARRHALVAIGRPIERVVLERVVPVEEPRGRTSASPRGPPSRASLV